MNRLARKKYQCTNNQSVNNSDVGKPTWDKDKIKQTKNNCPWRRFAEAENYTLKKQIFSNARRSERLPVPRFCLLSAIVTHLNHHCFCHETVIFCSKMAIFCSQNITRGSNNHLFTSWTGGLSCLKCFSQFCSRFISL